MFSLHLYGFPPNAPGSTHIPKIHKGQNSPQVWVWMVLSPMIDWRPAQGDLPVYWWPDSFSKSPGIGFSFPRILMDKQYRSWMDESSTLLQITREFLFPQAYDVLILACTGPSGETLNNYISAADTNKSSCHSVLHLVNSF